MEFFLLTFVLTWSCFGTLAILGHSTPLGVAGYALLLLGTFAPSIVAVCLTYRAEVAPPGPVAGVWEDVTDPLSVRPDNGSC